MAGMDRSKKGRRVDLSRNGIHIGLFYAFGNTVGVSDSYRWINVRVVGPLIFFEWKFCETIANDPNVLLLLLLCGGHAVAVAVAGCHIVVV